VEREGKGRRERAGERLVGLFVLGCVLFSPPLVVLAGGADLFGLPSGYAYLFLVWAGIIAGLALVVEGRARRARSGRRRW
jgi:hypothetical protein